MILQKKPTSHIEVDLTGPQGNAFYLLGLASNLAKQIGWSGDETKALMDEMKASDYEHLLKTFDKHFGSFVILYR
jgi:hypothetical protein